MNILDVFEDVFGEAVGPDLVSSVERVPSELLYRLRDRHREFAATMRVPPKELGHVRPFLPLDHRIMLHGTDAGPAHALALVYGEDLARGDPRGERIRPIAQHLLYCHSVALSNPLNLILDGFGSSYSSRRNTGTGRRLCCGSEDGRRRC